VRPRPPSPGHSSQGDDEKKNPEEPAPGEADATTRAREELGTLLRQLSRVVDADGALPTIAPTRVA
jgi:hypothetical protein